jgi:anti-anti-sigma factor
MGQVPGTGGHVLLVGDDWAEDHHDVELMDQAGRTLARARLPEGAAGMARLHAMIGEQLGEGAGQAGVRVGIETDRGLWVAALAAAGYVVYGINPLQVARYRQRHGTSGAKSDTADAHILADMVRTDAHQLRPVAGDSTFVVDMTGTRLCTSAGLGVLVRAHDRALAEGGELRLVIPASCTVLRVFAMSGLDRLIPNFPGLDEALRPAPAASALPRPRPKPGMRPPADRQPGDPGASTSPA